jgi:hypothetical protein
MPWYVPAQVGASVMITALSPMTLRAIRSTRLVISDAARRENVIRRIRRGSAPWTIRWASVLAFPDPAPAMTSKGGAANHGTTRPSSHDVMPSRVAV